MAANFDLHGRVAIVTGGNGGLGLSIAKALGGAGAKVLIAGRDPAKSSIALEQLRALGIECLSAHVDVTSQSSCTDMVEYAVHELGTLDILVNNAGVSVRETPQNISIDQWNGVLDINASGALRCAQAAYPHLKQSDAARIINIASIYANLTSPLAIAYAASKGALVQMSRTLAVAWAPDAINVNVLAPGWFDTEMNRNARERIPELAALIKTRTPLGRVGNPDELAGAAVFLASPAASFVTGTTLTVDGGFSVQV